MVKQGVSVRPRLPLCVCEGVLLVMMLPVINHVFLRRGKTGETGKKITGAVLMAHRHEGTDLAAVAAESSRGSPPPPVPVSIFLLLLLHPPDFPARKPTLCHRTDLIRSGTWAQGLAAAPALGDQLTGDL